MAKQKKPKISVRSKILIFCGNLYGNPMKWGIPELDCTKEEFYALEEDRPAANHNGSLSPKRISRHISMKRNFKVELRRAGANRDLTILFPTIALALIFGTHIYFKSDMSMERSMQLTNQLRNANQTAGELKPGNPSDGIGRMLINWLKAINKS